MHRLATVDGVTVRQTDGQTDWNRRHYEWCQ